MARYDAVHRNPAGPGDSRPTALQIIRDEKLVCQMKDKVRLLFLISFVFEFYSGPQPLLILAL
jgi:hypothetical protein